MGKALSINHANRFSINPLLKKIIVHRSFEKLI